jgi:hypothetical protein
VWPERSSFLSARRALDIRLPQEVLR